MSYLVADLEDRFSRDEAHMIVQMTISPLRLPLKPRLIQYPRVMLTVQFPKVMLLYRICTDFVFRSKGLHIANLNIHHLLPKLDGLRISLAYENGPDLLGICETFLNESISYSQLTIDGFDHIRKGRSVTQDKSGVGVILYFRNNINCKRRPEFEISNLETIWSKIISPNSKPFQLCTAYRPPNVTSNWIDLLEEELSATQSSGLEIII